jgi:hypothetical protein
MLRFGAGADQQSVSQSVRVVRVVRCDDGPANGENQVHCCHAVGCGFLRLDGSIFSLVGRGPFLARG